MNNEIIKRILSSVILISIIYFIITNGSILFNLFLITCLVVILYEWHLMSKKKKYYYPGIIFISLSFFCAYKLNNYNDNNINFILVLLICISTDIGGYVIGKLFKGPKLTSISPKKTYSGLLGGFLFAFIFIFVFTKSSFFSIKTPDNYINLFLLVMLISSVSQIGDITISYFKRLSKIKDTGNLIPGHGGLLDRTDGMIFAFPFYYIILLMDLILIF